MVGLNGRAIRTSTFVFIILALLLGLWAMPVYAQEVPPVPHAFYGNLIINGNPASIGTEVEAGGEGVITGIEGNPITTTKEGKYGGPDLFDPKLIVQGDISPDAAIRFYVNGVDTGTTYSFRSGETTRLDLSVTIATLAVATNAATSITTTSATLKGNLVSLGTASSVTVSFEWGTTTSYGNETTPETMSSIGSFSAALGGLTPATTYHFRAKVVNNDTTYGLDRSFTTTATGGGGGGGGSGQTSMTATISSQGVMTQSVTAESEDGVCRLTIDNGIKALDKNGSPLSQITITPMSQPPPLPEKANVIGLTYDLEPDGATFAPPITLEYSYDPSDIPNGVNEDDLVVAYYDKDIAKWVELESTVNTATNTITALISHFTTFAILGYETAAPSALVPPSAFSLSSLTISPTGVNIGETVNIGILIANTGGQSGNYKVILKVGDEVEAIKEVTVAAGTSKQVSFSTVKDVAGTYSVDVSGLTGSFTVKEAAVVPAPSPPAPASPTSPAKPINWPVLGGIIAGVVLLITVISLLVRRRA